MKLYERAACANIDNIIDSLGSGARPNETVMIAQVQATLAVAEQLRIANLIALKECLAPTPLGDLVGQGAATLDPSEELCSILGLSPDEYPGHGKSGS
jgi:hypothetical protein